MVVDKLFETDLADMEAVYATLEKYVLVRIISIREDALFKEADLNDKMPDAYWDKTLYADQVGDLVDCPAVNRPTPR